MTLQCFVCCAYARLKATVLIRRSLSWQENCFCGKLLKIPFIMQRVSLKEYVLVNIYEKDYFAKNFIYFVIDSQPNLNQTQTFTPKINPEFNPNLTQTLIFTPK